MDDADVVAKDGSQEVNNAATEAATDPTRRAWGGLILTLGWLAVCSGGGDYALDPMNRME
jgi:hypothetical protein